MLGAYPLNATERGWVEALDVRAIADAGASQMLLFVAWLAVKGGDHIPEYMKRMNGPAIAS